MIIDLSLNIDLRIHYIVDFDAIKPHAQDKYLPCGSSRILSSSSRMSFRSSEIPKIINMSLYLNARMMARSD